VPRGKPRRRLGQVVLGLVFPGDLRPWVVSAATVLSILAVVVLVVFVLNQPRQTATAEGPTSAQLR
jgi:hypothetical protein